MESKNNLLNIKAFSESVKVEGKTYYDCHSRMFSIIRLPAIIRTLFPQVARNKIIYDILCFPNKEKLQEHIDKSGTVPLILELYERPQ